MLVWENDKLLLIERKKPPFGFAAPAGHVDEHGTFEDAAKQELLEEVGLKTTELKLVLEEKRDNPCRREGGSWHYWKVYEAQAEGETKRSEDETKQAGWYNKEQIEELSKRTEAYESGEISEADWEQNPGLEPVWQYWLKKLGVV